MTAEAILWRDAHSVDTWTYLHDIEMEPRKVLSIGIVVKETDLAIAISAGLGDDKDACATLVIPKVLIVTRNVLASSEEIEAWLK